MFFDGASKMALELQPCLQLSLKEEPKMFRDPRGCIIHDRGSDLVGAVNEVYCDPETHRARYAEVTLSRHWWQGEASLLYPVGRLSWTAAGSLFMNDWIEDALHCGKHSFSRIMHLHAYALETLDQASLGNPALCSG